MCVVQARAYTVYSPAHMQKNTGGLVGPSLDSLQATDKTLRMVTGGWHVLTKEAGNEKLLQVRCDAGCRGGVPQRPVAAGAVC